MYTAQTKTAIEEISRGLKTRATPRRHKVLFLGARAGGLFGNENLYQLMKNYSLTSFDSLSNKKKFEECYEVLNSQIFDEKSIDKISTRALRALYYREEDEYLVSLLEAKLFDVVITTNIDHLLEEALTFRGMRSPRDYEEFTYSTPDIAKRMQSEPPKYCRIIKVFGDVKSQQYKTVGKEFDLEGQLKDVLVSQLQGDVLLVGYDPFWDKLLERAFPETGGKLWYVNEEPPDPYLAHLLEKRGGRYLEAQWGSYAGFWKALYDLTRDGVQHRGEVASHRSSSQAVSLTEDKVFIAYSRKDEIYVKRLQVHLKGLLHLRKDKKKEDDLIIKWPVTQLAPKSGKKWREEIEKALASSKAAILLLSADFLNAPGIRDQEFPKLVKAAEERNIAIYPVILDAGLFRSTPFTQYQTINGTEEPLEGMEPYEQDVLWNDLTGRVCNILTESK